ncbi:hypothetical protein ACFLSX_05265 [Calditrichota bacterium]
MNYLRYVFVILLAIVFTGCSSNITEPIEVSQQEILRISGALNTSFMSDETEYQCRGTIKTWDIGNTLILSVQATSNSSSSKESLSLYMYIPLKSNEIPKGGENLIHDISDNFSGISYQSQWDERSLSKYRLETGLARIFIETSEDNHLVGKFSLSANQTYGQRMLDGQVENIQLANEGKITVAGKIDVELDI